jgi:hypothetical protein
MTPALSHLPTRHRTLIRDPVLKKRYQPTMVKAGEGRRDYAILLLARLGLRAGEVSAITLELVRESPGHKQPIAKQPTQ